jgi:hypothetical protein
VQEPNIRYLALENLTRLALVPEVLESIREHQVRADTCAPPACVSVRCMNYLWGEVVTSGYFHRKAVLSTTELLYVSWRRSGL